MVLAFRDDKNQFAYFIGLLRQIKKKNRQKLRKGGSR